MVFSKAITGSAVAFLAVISTTSMVNAELKNHETRFSVKFGGIEVGIAKFKIQFDDNSYSLTGSGKTTGLVEWLAPSTGKFISAGAMIDDQLQPKTHQVSVKERKKKEESVKLSFANDRVTNVKIKANKKRNRIAPRYVPLEAKHMAAVIDPVSTLIVPMSGQAAKDGKQVCNQHLPVFDGETRYDIKLSYKSTKKINTQGYNGHAYVCRMRYVPVAGHKKTIAT